MSPYHPLDGEGVPSPTRSPALIAVDLGLRAGLATYARTGHLLSFRSTNFGTVSRMKRAIGASFPLSIEVLVTEGDSHLASLWERCAQKRQATSYRIAPSQWRNGLYRPSQMRSKGDWKKKAIDYAERVILWSECPKPTSLRHDAAEAVCLGFFMVMQLGWLPRIPEEMVAR